MATVFSTRIFIITLCLNPEGKIIMFIAMETSNLKSQLGMLGF